jgi:hypothetical protein
MENKLDSDSIATDIKSWRNKWDLL